MTFPRWMRDLGKVYKEQGPSLFVEVPLTRFEQTMKAIESHGIRTVNAITGCDSGSDMEVLYHFVHTGIVLTIKFRVDRKEPVIPTVTRMFPSGMVLEQETFEMLGVDFAGNRSLRMVLLTDKAPKNPLCKNLKSILPPGGMRPASARHPAGHKHSAAPNRAQWRTQRGTSKHPAAPNRAQGRKEKPR